MRELGHDPFAVEEFKRTHAAHELLKKFDELAGDAVTGQPAATISFAGRVVSYRDMGKAGFAHLSDGDGKIQVYCRKDELGEVAWELYQLLDIGDHVGVWGYLFVTKTGEKSIHVQELVPLSKSLQVLPIGKSMKVENSDGTLLLDASGEPVGKDWYGLEDVEQRYRNRHLDLLTNPEARKMLLDRARIVSAVRRYFDSQGYLEVETPILQVVAGGAAARPFTTHYNAYDIDVKLRISLELYLKRLICGDIPAVYEIGRVFRNEGVSNRHNPEFSLLEFYEAYTNLEGMMRRVEEMFAFVARNLYGTTIVKTPKAIGGFFRRHNVLLHHGPAWLAPLMPLPNVKFSEMVRRMGWKRVASLPRLTSSPLQPTVAKGKPKFFRDSVGREYVVLSRNVRVDQSRRDTLEAGIYEFEYFEGDLIEGATSGGEIIDFSKPWRRVDLLDEISRLAGLDRSDLSDLETAKSAIQAKGVLDKAHALGAHIDLEKENNYGGLIEKLLEVFVEPTLQEPTFVVGYPIEVSPLAKKDPTNPRMTRRFEGYILGREMCNAFSEINDPIDQKERFEQQASEIAKGDDEAHPYDEEFLYALEGGMPPTGGCGIGMERLAMVFTGADHIREIMFFPMMKPVAKQEE